MKRSVTRLFTVALGVRTLRALTCAVLLVTSALTAHAGINVWTSHGPYSTYGYLTWLVMDPSTPSTLYAWTEGGGVFRSTDSGGSWSQVNTGLSNLNVTVLAIDPTTPSTLYAGTYGGGIFKSTNSGGSWSAVNTGLSGSPSGIYALAVDPITPSTLYAGIYQVGVFKSTNSGGSWVNIGLTNLNVDALAIDPSTPSTLYAGTAGGGIFQSTNSGGSWSVVNTGLSDNTVFALAIDPSTPSTLYAGTSAGVFDSEQGPPPPMIPTLSTWGIIGFSTLAFAFVLWGAGGSRWRSPRDADC